jgi:hypothetical protein
MNLIRPILFDLKVQESFLLLILIANTIPQPARPFIVPFGWSINRNKNEIKNIETDKQKKRNVPFYCQTLCYETTENI